MNKVRIGVFLIFFAVVGFSLSMSLENNERLKDSELTPKKTWYAAPLSSFTCMSNAEGDTNLIKIGADNCGTCVGVSKNPSGEQLAEQDDKWQIDEGLVEIDYSLCDDSVLSPGPYEEMK